MRERRELNSVMVVKRDPGSGLGLAASLHLTASHI